MANILVNIEKGVEIGAEDALKWLTGANKTLQAAPAVVAALATLIGAVEKPLSELAGAAANPLNIPLDVQTVADLKAVWPQVKTFLGTLGPTRKTERARLQADHERAMRVLDAIDAASPDTDDQEQEQHADHR